MATSRGIDSDRNTEVEAALTASEIEAARRAGAPYVLRTPLFGAEWLNERAGATVRLKAESLQRTGSFKVRGAFAKLERLEPGGPGVVAASAGNHGQALAYAARVRGIGCRVFMPATASVGKVEAVEAYDGEVELGGGSVDECLEMAREYSERTGAAFVHPFDDVAVLAGQATLGAELLEDSPGLAAVVIPIGGGGLAGAMGLAMKRARPDLRIVGVQLETCAPYVDSSRGIGDLRFTLADGIAVKRPGTLTSGLIERYIDEICTVSEDSIAEAMVLLMQRAKLVVEGAGAAGVAALLEGAVAPAADGETAVILSGGNVDVGALAAITRRHESRSGRRVHLFTRVPDRPGGLAALLATVAEAGANLIALEHLRDAVSLHVRETGVELILETRGPAHSERVVTALEAAGYDVAAPRFGEVGGPDGG